MIEAPENQPFALEFMELLMVVHVVNRIKNG
jgi:hypothetical protein